MSRKRPKWEQKIPKIQAFVLRYFCNLEPLENGGKCREIDLNGNKKCPKSRHSQMVTHFSITRAQRCLTPFKTEQF